MSGGFFALLDDIAVLAKMAAATIDDVAVGATKAAAKSVGILVDDAAVTPKYLTDVSPKRELPVVWAITKKSIFNKLCLVIPVIMVLMWIAPWVLPFILIVGGCYLIFEGTEKVVHWIQKKDDHGGDSEKDEKKVIANASRTDLVLSFEIMLISLSAVDTTDWIDRALILIVVAFLMTIIVYGAVALLIKIDDVGLFMVRNAKSRFGRLFGLNLVKSMPAVFQVITVIGTVAMLWVGGHILLVSLSDVGVPFFYDSLKVATDAVAGAGGFVVWVVDAALSAILGFIVGLILVPIIVNVEKVIHKFKKPKAAPGETAIEATDIHPVTEVVEMAVVETPGSETIIVETSEKDKSKE